MSGGAQAAVDILLVEDSEDDAILTDEALKECGVAYRLHRAEDGEDALRFLRREGEHGGAPRPHLVLLDWKLPGMSGLDVLRAVKGDAGLMSLPVVILSTSRLPQDVLAGYRHHANCFIVKPADINVFFDMMRQTVQFWIRTATLPPER